MNNKKSKPLSKNDDKGEYFLDHIIEKRTNINIDQFAYDKIKETYYLFNFSEIKTDDDYINSGLNSYTGMFIKSINPDKNIFYFDIKFDWNKKIVNVTSHDFCEGYSNKKDPYETQYTFESFSKFYRSFSLKLKDNINTFKLARTIFDKKKYFFNENFDYIKSNKKSFEFSNYMLQGDQTVFFNVDDIYINDNNDIKLIELLNCSSQQKIGPLQSHPNRYIGKNVNKFLSIYQLGHDTNSDIVFINYAENDSPFHNDIKIMINDSKDKIENTLNILKNTNYNLNKSNITVFNFDKDIKANQDNIKEKIMQELNPKDLNAKNKKKFRYK